MAQKKSHKIDSSKISGFEFKKAQELIFLGREARHLFNQGRDLREDSKKLKKDISLLLPQKLPLPSGDPIPEQFKGNEYEILAPLVFTQLVLRFIGSRQVFGFIAKPKDSADLNDYLLIVYRGSQTIGDWFSNFRIFQSKQSLFSKETSVTVPGEVHKGFKEQYTRPDKKRNLPSISNIVEKTLTADVVKDRTIYIAGHSLGGALATLTAAHVKKLYPKANVHLYTTASPRVGDSSFKEFFDTNSIPALRIYNTVDKVPKLPPRFESPFEAAQYDDIGRDLDFTNKTNSIQFNHTLPVYACALGLNPQDFNYLPDKKPLPISCKD